MTRKPRNRPDPQAHEDFPDFDLPAGIFDPAEDVDLSPRPPAALPLDLLPSAMEGALHLSSRTAPLRADIYWNEDLRGMGSPFESGYTHIVAQAKEVIGTIPEIAPDKLRDHLWAAQRTASHELLELCLDQGLSDLLIQWSCANFLGAQAALEVFEELMAPTRRAP